jgi:hypothetical protein
VELKLTVGLYLIVALMINTYLVMSMNMKGFMALMINAKVSVLMNATATINSIGWVARVEGRFALPPML